MIGEVSGENEKTMSVAHLEFRLDVEYAADESS
jgi:hypothetical protein